MHKEYAFPFLIELRPQVSSITTGLQLNALCDINGINIAGEELKSSLKQHGHCYAILVFDFIHKILRNFNYYTAGIKLT